MNQIASNVTLILKGGIYMTFNKDIEFILSKFSHEIRNPLTALYSTVQLMELKHPEVKEFKYWESMIYDIEYMNQLLDELSNFTKSERLNLTSIELRPFLERISLSFAASIANSEVMYTSEIDPYISQITGDKTKLQEVFLNLLKNAFDAARPNHSIRFTAHLVEGNVVIKVQDTGCGITKEQLPTIFEPFVTYKKQGTGLGLAICDHVIKAHGGTISVESEPGVGTTFCMTLKAE